MSDDIRTQTRQALDDVQYTKPLVMTWLDGHYLISTTDVRTAGLVSNSTVLIPRLLTELERVDAENEQLRGPAWRAVIDNALAENEQLQAERDAAKRGAAENYARAQAIADDEQEAINQRDEALAALAARDSLIRQVREMHRPIDGEWSCEADDCAICQAGDIHEGDVCDYCAGFDNAVFPWPCPTIQIIGDGS